MQTKNIFKQLRWMLNVTTTGKYLNYTFQKSKQQMQLMSC